MCQYIKAFVLEFVVTQMINAQWFSAISQDLLLFLPFGLFLGTFASFTL